MSLSTPQGDGITDQIAVRLSNIFITDTNILMTNSNDTL